MNKNSPQTTATEITDTENKNGVNAAKKSEKDEMDLTDEEIRNVAGGGGTIQVTMNPQCKQPV